MKHPKKGENAKKQTKNNGADILQVRYCAQISRLTQTAQLAPEQPCGEIELVWMGAVGGDRGCR
jgi:hypothetical protein